MNCNVECLPRTPLKPSLSFRCCCLPVMLALAAGASLAADDERLADTWLKPRALRAGDTIQFVALSGPVNEQRVALCRERFEKMGFRISLAEKLSGRDRYLAGSDDDRVNEINAALHDPRVAAIFPCRGGYGLTRILDRIDYDALRASPKMIIGFSDVTALHLAVARKARVITFHSPMPEFSLLKDNGEYAYSFNSFWHMVRLEKHQDGPGKWDIDLPQSGPRPSTLVGGKARGRLLGGNLSLVCATLGTPYALEAKGAILFLEDTGEAPYRIDRMLSQLRLAGILSQVSGVVLGTFERTDEKEVQTVLKDYFAKLKVPVVMNFPIGHGTYNATLPHGALAELDADDLHLRLLESPVRAE